jgi:hypothetical protein
MATPHVPPYTVFTLAAARRQLTQLRKTHKRVLRTDIRKRSALIRG